MAEGKRKPTRTLNFSSLDDIVAEARNIASSQCTVAGNWTPAQNIAHVALVVKFSLDGFPAEPPLPIKLIGRLLKGRFLSKTFSPGVNLPASMSAFMPDAGVGVEDALAELESLCARTKDEAFIGRSPLFGKMSPGQWVRMHCRHAELHFGFVEPS